MNTVGTRFFTFADTPRTRFPLQRGGKFGPITLAYETYGRLSAKRDNAILVFHALSGSQHAAGHNPSVPGIGKLWTEECRTGWWNGFIGPGKALDTRRFFVVCANYLGGCYGSTGPRSINPQTRKPYGGAFPRVSVSDIVDSQMALLDHLDIRRLHAVTGGSLGGMMALNLALRHPDRVEVVIPIACGLEVTTLQRIHNFEQIFAIEEDAAFNRGDYYDGPAPEKGLALARMIGHKTYVSLHTMASRARHEIVHRERELKLYELTHPLESYMLHQGQKFVRRFDANTYLRIMDAWQHVDLLKDAGARDWKSLFRRALGQRYLVFSIDSDVCYYPEEQADMVERLRDAGVPVKHITVHSDKGHDSFLVEPELYTPGLARAFAG
ncbi:MAG: homoserine O-acetyltransferase [Kiritimatiellae bacterium]|nr:homoserine O-acetyltransferase [Kiritimatiellia bacterium]